MKAPAQFPGARVKPALLYLRHSLMYIPTMMPVNTEDIPRYRSFGSGNYVIKLHDVRRLLALNWAIGRYYCLRATICYSIPLACSASRALP